MCRGGHRSKQTMMKSWSTFFLSFLRERLSHTAGWKRRRERGGEGDAEVEEMGVGGYRSV